MDKEQKKFISGTFFFLLGTAFVTVIPIVLRWLDLYYFMPIAQYKNLAILFGFIGLCMYLACNENYDKRVLVCLFAIFFMLLCRLFYL